jgi:hypothetical protein
MFGGTETSRSYAPALAMGGPGTANTLRLAKLREHVGLNDSYKTRAACASRHNRPIGAEREGSAHG